MNSRLIELAFAIIAGLLFWFFGSLSLALRAAQRTLRR